MKKVLLAVAVLGLVSGIQAAPIIDFQMNPIHPAGAGIVFVNPTVGLVGSNIGVDDVYGLDTPANNLSALTISNGILSFDSGAFVGMNGSSYVFGNTGVTSISIVGGIPSLNIPDGTVLMEGSVSSIEVSRLNNGFWTVDASFTDTKNADLAAYFGMQGGADAPWAGGVNLQFAMKSPGLNLVSTTADLQPIFESSRVLSGDVSNSPVPEPMTILMVGTGLMGLGLIRRKKA